jgi:hypothetical protein
VPTTPNLFTAQEIYLESEYCAMSYAVSTCCILLERGDGKMSLLPVCFIAVQVQADRLGTKL